jgi:hypothetical protein
MQLIGVDEQSFLILAGKPEGTDLHRSVRLINLMF